jgi:hypothetical protein
MANNSKGTSKADTSNNEAQSDNNRPKPKVNPSNTVYYLQDGADPRDRS